MKRFLLLCGIGLLLTTSAYADFTIEDDGESLTVMEDRKPVFVYRYGMVEPPEGVGVDRRRLGYIHPLYGLDGEVLTQDFPDDHHHHRGVFWAWPDTSVGGRKMDIWTLGGARTAHEKFTARKAGHDSAFIGAQNLWVFDETPDDPKVREDVRVTVHPAKRKTRAIDFHIVFENICEEDVVFRGSAAVEGTFRTIKGYGGFCVRPDAERQPMSFTSANKVIKHDALRMESPWVDVSFPKKKDGKRESGLAVFQHPSNPGYPHPGWLLRHYGFLGQSWPCDQSHTLKPGQRVELRYRILVHRGDAESARVAKAFQAYAEGVQSNSEDAPSKPEDFAAVEKLPDPFLFLDGTRVETKEDWTRRRAEILDLILRIQYGHLPKAPGNITLKRIFGEETLNDGATRLEKHYLSMGPGDRMRAQLDLYFPAKIDTPRPVILRVGWGCPIVEEVNERGYIFAGYGIDHFDRSEMGKPVPGSVERHYPDNDGGTLAAWAWGASRMLDYLETLPQVDASKVIITGHSRCGKAAILAGAVDERFAMVVPNGSGCGGVGLYRVLGPDCEDLEAITKPERWQEWLHKDFRAYAGKEAHLPFDQHFMRALVAPRPVLNTDGTEDTWANPIGEQINYLAAQPVYDFLGVPERNGMHFRPGGHDHGAVDFRALLDFADWHLFGKKSETEFNKLPFPEHMLDVDWGAP